MVHSLDTFNNNKTTTHKSTLQPVVILWTLVQVRQVVKWIQSACGPSQRPAGPGLAAGP